MNPTLRTTVITLLAIVLSACGGVRHTVTTPPGEAFDAKQVTLLPTEVSSKEQTPEALSLNAQWREMATKQLQSLLAARHITTSAGSQTQVACKIEVTYGSRAKRYLLGFGAGAGHVRTTIEIREPDGKVRYSASSDADLAIGLFGGDMSNVVEKTIKAAVEEFGTHL
ncbi:MAG: DUF4410 domain-containing protein [Luteimonas sp.]